VSENKNLQHQKKKTLLRLEEETKPGSKRKLKKRKRKRILGGRGDDKNRAKMFPAKEKRSRGI